MVMPFEAEQRRTNREKLQRAVLCLPRTSDVSSFLADIAQHVLNLQMRLEDTLLLAEGIVADATSAQCKEDMVLSLRAAVPAVQELYGKIYMAATTDCASVVEAMQVAEDVPGLTPQQVKAIRELHAKRTLLRKMEESEVHRLQGGLPQAHPAAVTVSASKSLVGLAGLPAPKQAGYATSPGPKLLAGHVTLPAPNQAVHATSPGPKLLAVPATSSASKLLAGHATAASPAPKPAAHTLVPHPQVLTVFFVVNKPKKSVLRRRSPFGCTGSSFQVSSIWLLL